MINSQMKPYILCENKPIRDADGHIRDSFTPIGEVMLVVSFVAINQISQDMHYKDCRYSGLTVFKGFEAQKDYRLTAKDGYGSSYLIKSINTLTRLTQLLLQEVRI